MLEINLTLNFSGNERMPRKEEHHTVAGKKGGYVFENRLHQ